MTSWAVAAALCSAVCYAAAAALQEHEASAPAGRASGQSLVRHLCCRPRWIAGIVAMISGAGLHAVALSYGPLPLIQPIGVVVLLFALPFGAALHRRRVHLRDWCAAAAVVVGLSVFLGAVHVHSRTPHMSPGATLMLVACTILGIGVCLALAPRRNARYSAILLAAAAGIAFGASSALVRATGARVVTHGATALIGWPIAAVAVVLPLGFVLSQYAYRTGSLGAALSTMTVVDPLTAIIFATGLLGETLHAGVLAAAVAFGAGALVIAGIVVLAGGEPLEQSAPTVSPRIPTPRSLAAASTTLKNG